MKRQEFLDIVQKELDHIKANATKEEIGKLNINHFDASHPKQCVYGQMTGDCQSFRAIELSPKKYMQLNTDDDDDGEIFTALEKYIYERQTANGYNRSANKDIIAYLQGRTDSINLK